MLNLLVLRCGRRRDSLLFHEGRPISAKSVCLRCSSFPRHSHIVRLPGYRRNSLVPAMCWRCGKFVNAASPSASSRFPPASLPPPSRCLPPPPASPSSPASRGDSSPELRETLSKDGGEGRRRDEGRIHFVSELLRACRDKALLIFGEKKKPQRAELGCSFSAIACHLRWTL